MFALTWIDYAGKKIHTITHANLETIGEMYYSLLSYGCRPRLWGKDKRLIVLENSPN